MYSMKHKILTRCVAFLLIVTICFQTAPRASAALANPSDAATAENVLEVLRQYDADAYHILKSEYDGGTDYLTEHAETFSNTSIICAINTAIHETYHGYTFHQANTFSGERIYLGGGKSYDVDYSVVYGGNFTKTEEMARSIPVELQTTRYKSYIAPGSPVTANTQGVFGLLNEFTAYYWGLETMNSLAQYLLDTDANAEDWQFHVRSVGNNLTAYAEFKYWTLHYMIYIKSANPALYQVILNNEAYCAAYAEADAKFVSEIDRSRKIVDNCGEYLRGKGYSVEWSDTSISLTRKDNSGVGVPLNDYTALMEELEKAEYTEMDSILKKNSPQQPSLPMAIARTQTVKLDGRDVEFQCYAVKDAGGNETNYVKLRDLAQALNGTNAQFNVGWDGKVSITSNTSYQVVGGEGTTPYSGNQPYKDVSDTPVSFNGSSVNLTSFSITYQDGGYTYYKLRDLGQLLNFNVKWDGGVVIETDNPYTGE